MHMSLFVSLLRVSQSTFAAFPMTTMVPAKGRGMLATYQKVMP